MSDAAMLQLLAALPADRATKFLVVLEENCRSEELVKLCDRLADFPNCQLLCNRFDLADFVQQRGLACQFSDLDFSRIEAGRLDAFFFRVAKEKVATHRVINAAGESLKVGGQLYLSGGKQEGIKTFISKAGELLNDPCRAKKSGDAYHALITKKGQPDELLDDNEYATVRNISPPDQAAYYSKPGVFGWNKIDQGSALLARHFAELIQASANKKSDWLDLGCGYGFLSVQAKLLADKFNLELNLIATDNSAAAITACEKNFLAYKITGKVIADDCALQITKKFDVVVSHPPFHKGFRTDNQLGGNFIVSARAHLKPGGKALMVANSFIPLEKLASEYFSDVRTLENNRQFKVVLMC